MTRYTVTRCSCGRLMGINGNDIHGASPRTTSDDLARALGSCVESRDIGRRPRRRASQPVGVLPASEGRKALSTTG